MSATSGTLEQDLACSTCGYNLRTLESHGRCPECGVLIGRSIAHDRWRRRTLDEADPVWLKQLLEGIWLALAVWFIVLALVLAPEEFRHWLWRWRSPQRAWLLGITCVWWTLSWAAVWKLSRVEPGPRALLRAGDALLPLAIRTAATIYLLVPLLFAWDFPFERLLVVLVFGMFGCGSLVGLALWARVFHLAGSAQRIEMQIQSVILAVASPLALWLTLFQGRSGTTSLDFMLHLPLPGLGWPPAVGYVIAQFDGPTHWMEWFILLHAILVFTALVQLLLMLMRAHRRAMANAGGRS